ncbi:hypothetical protein GH714_016673 [Hevea brasiliensis]|uniref:Gnk2-homologous domain-containing protein n=1 Tax=Hevea brasiliensis TaxID=3981 RepID=A0A6A6N281_HEVBR|nr:hypothetical protein GH714_016673 [Hevea brasiliensis]
MAAVVATLWTEGNFTTNSTYAKNRALVLSSLASNVTANGGFYTATVGQGTDKVYGLVLCRADTPSDACSKCVNTTITELIEKCPNQKEAISWGGDPPCIIRYANRSIFGLLELEPTDAGYNVNNITSNMEEFDQTWGGLMSRIVTKASMGSSKVKFATEEADLTPFQKIYALMLCTPDMSQSNCSYCLREAVGFYQSCCHGKQGGYVQKPNCIFRWDLYPFYNSIADALPPTPPPSISPPSTNNTISKENGTATTRTVVIITVPAIVFAALVALTCSLFYYRKSKQETKNLDENRSKECLKFNFETIRRATEDFSDHNKLGQGGFGAVYKGVLSDGQVVAVKRLSRNSKQEEVDIKNEVMLVARLQHRNLVRILGFCFEGHERLSYMICSKFKSRPLHICNILLDEEMNPKISDFGTARLFPTDQSEDATSKIVGTLVCISRDPLSKVRCFSFGVLILEIISGQKCNKFRNAEEEEERDLITYAWDNWIEGTASNIIDPILIGAASTPDILRCIQIGLLCVQADAGKRPTMASVVLMLDSCSVALPALSKPGYFVYSEHTSILSGNQSKSRSAQLSANQCSISELDPR